MRITVSVAKPNTLHIVGLGLRRGYKLSDQDLTTINKRWGRVDSAFSLVMGRTLELIFTDEDFSCGGPRFTSMAHAASITIAQSLRAMSISFKNTGWSCDVDNRTATQFTVDPENPRRIMIENFGLPKGVKITARQVAILNDQWPASVSHFDCDRDGKLWFIATTSHTLHDDNINRVVTTVRDYLRKTLRSLGIQLESTLDSYYYTRQDGVTFDQSGKIVPPI
jgi:hypothetical protein